MLEEGSGESRRGVDGVFTDFGPDFRGEVEEAGALVWNVSAVTCNEILRLLTAVVVVVLLDMILCCCWWC